MNNICDLPEGCLSHILSLTSPADVLRSSAVSKQFLSASVSDTVWRNFLRSDCDDVFAQSTSPIRRHQFSSKKELFLHLTRFPLLLENNTKSFALDKWNGKICYMLGARALTIIWESSPQYWNWESVPESRFSECAQLLDVCWLEIIGKIQTILLSPGSTYGAYFVLKINGHRYGSSGFEFEPVKLSVSRVGEDCLPRDDHHPTVIKSFYLEDPESEWAEQDDEEEIAPAEVERPVARDDGWMEIEMGRYQVGAHDAGEKAVLQMTLKEIEGGHWKTGLLVHGIELRPLC